MSELWAADFTYEYYRKLLRAAKRTFEPVLFREYRHRRDGGRPLLLLRHDVDVSPARAVDVARIEHEEGVCSTFMVIPNSPVYRIEDEANRQCLRAIRELGHEVGLHFDPPLAIREAGTPVDRQLDAIDAACRALAAASGAPVESISFHRPNPQFLRGPLEVGGRVNAYAAELMQWYLSDSKGRWREGEPLPRLARAEKPVLQLLTHPIWWRETHQPAAERLAHFFDSETATMTPDGVARFSRALHEALPEDWPAS